MSPLIEVVFQSVRISFNGFSSTLGPFPNETEAFGVAQYLTWYPRVARTLVPVIA